jgi:1,4-dihydroxy-2-naphthoate octaprenyltransferase
VGAVGVFGLLRVVRVPILVGGFLGCVLGAMLGLRAGGVFDLPLFAACYAVVAFGDLSTHFSNDYFDVALDGASPGKTFGGSKQLVGRPELLGSAITAARLLSVVSIVAACGAVALGVNILILPLAVGANALGWLYSLPPWRLAYRGFGELAIAVGTGFGVPAAGYLAAKGELDAGLLLPSAALILYGSVLAFSLELSDMETDRIGGKMNLVARFGWSPCLRVALLLCAASTALLWLLSQPLLAYASLVPLAAVILGNLYATGDRGRRDAVASLCISSLFVFLVASVVLLAAL